MPQSHTVMANVPPVRPTRRRKQASLQLHTRQRVLAARHAGPRSRPQVGRARALPRTAVRHRPRHSYRPTPPPQRVTPDMAGESVTILVLCTMLFCMVLAWMPPL